MEKLRLNRFVFSDQTVYSLFVGSIVNKVDNTRVFP